MDDITGADVTNDNVDDLLVGLKMIMIIVMRPTNWGTWIITILQLNVLQHVTLQHQRLSKLYYNYLGCNMLHATCYMLHVTSEIEQLLLMCYLNIYITAKVTGIKGKNTRKALFPMPILMFILYTINSFL